ncbi:MAG: sulfatase [Flavobacteriales bacterium]|nr:sulfatase [Flavobacteriales bacterium]
MKYLISILLSFLIISCQQQSDDKPIELQPQEVKQPKPNILFILVDDMGWSDLGVYGNKIHETPQVDKLAAAGMRFTNAYASCPICGPSRHAIMTGKFPSRTGFIDNLSDRKNRVRQFMKLKEFTFAEALKDSGYQTGFVGKWHLTDETNSHLPDVQGFDINIAGSSWGFPMEGFFSPYQMPNLKESPKDEYLTDRLTTEAIQVMEDFSKKAAPWLMYMSYYTVHSPYHAKEEKIEKYVEKARAAGKENFNSKYAAMVESMDENVGRLLTWLDEKDLRKNTIIIFTSDNGGSHRATTNAPLRGYKGEVYEGGIREPLIVDWPGVTKPGSICNAPVHSTDFYPSILEMAGLPLLPEQHQDGTSIVPALKGSKSFDRGPQLWFFPVDLGRDHNEPAAAIRIGDWKLIQFYNGKGPELYNLNTDISETNNLLKSNPEKATELQAKMDAMLEAHQAKIPE